MSETLKVGDVLWWASSSRGDGWTSYPIIGETARSWIVKWGWSDVAVRKTDLTAAPSRPHHDPNREKFYTTEQKDALEAESAWMKKYSHAVRNAVAWHSNYRTLKVCYDALVAAGLLTPETEEVK